ncbi:MAG: DUF4925 domain-containing protein [Tannerellaceae bacterium]|jgi:hypothetical protein|nr:DUF4925 domain-containing protein [Tannerellaceae bacterium]
MKRIYLFYFAMICTGILLTSCGKDDEPDTNAAWKEAVGVYKAGGDLKLTMNGIDQPVGGLKEATIATGTGESAKIRLTNIVPEAATIEIDNVVMVKEGDDKFTFTGETTGDYTTVTVKGSLTGVKEKAKTLDLNVTRKVISPLTGVWKLAPASNALTSVGMVYINAKTADQASDAIFNSVVPGVIGGMLAQKVTDVTVTLGEDGLFDVNWTETGASTPTGMPDFVKQLVSIQYFVSDNKLYLALDKSVLPLLSAIPLPEGININALIGALAEDKGGFIALPVSWKNRSNILESLRDTSVGGDVNSAIFYVGKEMLKAILPMLMPSIAGGLPPEMLPLIQGLPEIVAGAETFDVGLGFERK